MKKPSRKRLVKSLDEVVSLIVRARDKRCVQCGSTTQPTNGHVLAGRFHALRWDIRLNGNCHQQCWPCNYKHTHHQNFYHDWFRNKFGEKKWKELQYEYYGNTHKFTDKELREMLEKLKGLINYY